MEWRTFLLKLFGKLLCQRPCCKTAKRASSCNAPFVNAVSLAEVRALEMLAGRLVTASNNNSKMSVASSNTFRCSQVHPPGPGDEPRGDVLRLFKKASLSSVKGESGTKPRTCSTPVESLEVASFAIRQKCRRCQEQALLRQGTDEPA